MGLLDGILGNVLGGNQAQPQGQDPLGAIFSGLAGGNSGGTGNILLQLGLSMLQQNGGLEGVLGKFRQAGMGAQADSWVSTGQNMNISSDQLQEALVPALSAISLPNSACPKIKLARRCRKFFPN